MNLGIDIGGTSVKAALFDQGQIRATATSDPYSRPDQSALLAAIRLAVSRLHGLDQQRIAAAQPTIIPRLDHVGLCAPGLYDPAHETITTSVNVPGLCGVPLRQLLSAAMSQSLLSLVVLTDAHAAALDLIASEEPTPVGRLLAISLGTGVGASVLDDRVPLLISGTSPGHFGQIDATIHEPGTQPPLGPDGGSGGLEAYIGLPALIARLRCSPQTLVPALQADPVPLLALARAIRIAHAIYRPAHVRLLGGVGIRFGPLLPFLYEQVTRNLTSLARPGWTLGCGSTEFHAARGAARAANDTTPV